LQDLSAKEVVNTWSEEPLGRILRDLGEEPRWRRICKAIIEHRDQGGSFETTLDLALVIERAVGWKRPSSPGRRKLHPATQTFQALRILVNDELQGLETAIPDCVRLLRPGSGRLAIISFHSLEDRIVKSLFREESSPPEGRTRLLTRKPVIASPDEVKRNPRARSAKLRVLERLEPGVTVGTKHKNKYAHLTVDSIRDPER